MEINKAFETLKKSSQFTDWEKKNSDAFFSYAFKMIESDKEQPWQLGFYHKSTDKVVTFVINDDNIEMQKEEEIFKKPDTKVYPVDIEKVKISFKKILKKAEELQKKEYSKEIPNKTIAILQNLDGSNLVWNLTYITHSLSTLNIKVNAQNGDIVSHSINSLMNFIQK